MNGNLQAVRHAFNASRSYNKNECLRAKNDQLQGYYSNKGRIIDTVRRYLLIDIPRIILREENRSDESGTKVRDDKFNCNFNSKTFYCEYLVQMRTLS